MKWFLPIAFTVVWICIVGIYFYVSGKSLFALEPNNFGDFLAGVSAPPVLIWLIFGYLLQARELGNQVEQTKELVAAARDEIKQSEFFSITKLLPRFIFASHSYNKSVEGGLNLVLKNVGAGISNLSWEVMTDCFVQGAPYEGEVTSCEANGQIIISKISPKFADDKRTRLIQGIPEVLPIRIRFKYQIQGGDYYFEHHEIRESKNGDLINEKTTQSEKDFDEQM